LDKLLSFFVATRHDLGGSMWMLDEAGDRLIQSVTTGVMRNAK